MLVRRLWPASARDSSLECLGSILNDCLSEALAARHAAKFSLFRGVGVPAAGCGVPPRRPFSKDATAIADAPPASAGADEEPAQSAPVLSEPWTYTFTEIPPDTTACRLSEEAKEAMYLRHREDPVRWSADQLAKEYRIRRQRAHAILWLKELEKRQEEELGAPLDDSIAKAFEARQGSFPRAAKEQHVKIYPSRAVEAIDDEGERMKKLLEESVAEEEWKVEEFVRRMNFNKLQMAGAVKVNKLERRRPAEGWSYVVEELGAEGRRGRSGGRRHVVGPDGSIRPLNDLEKVFLAREKVRPKRRLIPR